MLNLRLPLARLSRAAEAGSPTRRSSRRSPPAWRDDVAADVRRRPWAVPWRREISEGMIDYALCRGGPLTMTKKQLQPRNKEDKNGVQGSQRVVR